MSIAPSDLYPFLPRPAIIAHRGASAYAPENTLAAFELALRQEADGVELDAKLTADGHVIVFHDQTVERTTEGQGRVLDLTLAQLRKLDAGSHFDIAFQGEPGAYSHQACLDARPGMTPLPCRTFEDVITADC